MRDTEASPAPVDAELRGGVEYRFAHYLWGKAPAWALSTDQRFSYYAYTPVALQKRRESIPLVIVIHGTLRQPQVYRDEFVEFAERHQCAVLAPLFPAGIEDTADIDNYKRIAFNDIRFDHILINMVAEYSQRYGLTFGKWYLHGFSGGGQFAHRFFYLHPERLAAVSVGAPGAVTLVDDTRDWWVGTANAGDKFGRALDVGAMRDVRVLLVIGADDSGAEEVSVPPGSRHWMPDANHAGSDRQARLESLRRNLDEHGIDVVLERVPGVAHRGRHVMPAVRHFFEEAMRRRGEIAEADGSARTTKGDRS